MELGRQKATEADCSHSDELCGRVDLPARNEKPGYQRLRALAPRFFFDKTAGLTVGARCFSALALASQYLS
jgi:hypothetical protein